MSICKPQKSVIYQIISTLVDKVIGWVKNTYGCRNNIFVINGIIYDIIKSKTARPAIIQIYDYSQMFDTIELEQALIDLFRIMFMMKPFQFYMLPMMKLTLLLRLHMDCQIERQSDLQYYKERHGDLYWPLYRWTLLPDSVSQMDISTTLKINIQLVILALWTMC